MRFSFLCAAVMLPVLSTQTTAQLLPLPGEKLPDLVQRVEETRFARIGKERGSGRKPHARRLDLLAPRLYPSGDFVNITALTWANHYRLVRSPEYQEGKAAAVAAGTGTGKWRAFAPAVVPPADVGRINAIAFHPSQPATIYAGTPAAGLWRTQDDGGTWQPLTESQPMLGVSDIAIDPLDPRTIYILTGDGDGGQLPSHGILKSTDGGNSWHPTGMIWKTDRLVWGYRLAIHPANPKVLLAATTQGLYRTVDGAARWEELLPGHFFDVLFHPTDPSIFYAATDRSVFRFEDVGESHVELVKGLPDQTNISPYAASDRIRLAVTPKSPDTLYALYGSMWGYWIGLYRSDDRGGTFTKRSSSSPPPRLRDPGIPYALDLSTPNILGEANGFRSQSEYDLAMAVSPSDVDRVHVGGIDTWRSDDGGKRWKITSRWTRDPGDRDYTHADIHVLAYRGSSLFAATDGGVFRSDDGGDNWRSIADFKAGMGIAQIYALCVSPHENVVYFGTQDNGTWRLEENGRLLSVTGGDGFVCQIDPANPKVVYTSVQYGEIYKSETGGIRRDSFALLSIPEAGEGPWLTPFVLGVDNPANIYACYTDLWLGTERGFAWKNLTRGAIGESKECTQVAIAPSEPKTIYVTKGAKLGPSRRPEPTRYPAFFGGSGVFRSTDGGATWQNISARLPLAEAAVTGLAVSPTDARRAWVTFSGYKDGLKVFGTADGGRTWTNLSTRALPNLPANTVAARKGLENGVFIGMDNGVYYRDDRLDDWVRFDGEPGARLPPTIVASLVIDEARQRLFAGTFGRAVWVSDLPSPCTENCNQPRRVSPARRTLELTREPGAYLGPAEIFE